LDGQFARIVVVTAYPRLVTPGWLGLLAESDLPIELSMHVRPLASVDVVRTLGIQIARLQSSRLAALRGERERTRSVRLPLRTLSTCANAFSADKSACLP
jgi:hypothetical protein